MFAAILLERLSATLNDRALLVSYLFLVNDDVLTTDYPSAGRHARKARSF